jgi:hypothetical protein
MNHSLQEDYEFKTVDKIFPLCNFLLIVLKFPKFLTLDFDMPPTESSNNKVPTSTYDSP